MCCTALATWTIRSSSCWTVSLRSSTTPRARADRAGAPARSVPRRNGPPQRRAVVPHCRSARTRFGGRGVRGAAASDVGDDVAIVGSSITRVMRSGRLGSHTLYAVALRCEAAINETTSRGPSWRTPPTKNVDVPFTPLRAPLDMFLADAVQVPVRGEVGDEALDVEPDLHREADQGLVGESRHALEEPVVQVARSAPRYRPPHHVAGQRSAAPRLPCRDGASQAIQSTTFTTTVRIRDPRIIAFHGMNTRTLRSFVRASSALGDVNVVKLRATRSPAPGNARSPTLRSTVRITERPTEITSHRTAPASRRRCPPLPRDHVSRTLTQVRPFPMSRDIKVEPRVESTHDLRITRQIRAVRGANDPEVR